MLTRFVRYLITSAVLLATSVAGLPLVLCVSSTHSVAVEIERLHHDTQSGSNDHFILFSNSHAKAESEPCTDYRLQHASFFKHPHQSKPSDRNGENLGGYAPALLPTSSELLAARFHCAISHATFDNPPHLRSTLSDRSTIVLQI